MWLLLGVAVLLGAAPAFAQQGGPDYPATALFYLPTGDEMTTVTCDPPSAEGMKCVFTQTHILRKAKPEDDAKIPEQVKELMASPMDGKECDQIDLMATAFKTGVAPPGAKADAFYAKMKSMSEQEKRDTIVLFKAMADFCHKPNKENATELVKTERDKDRRTCKIWSNSFENTLQRNESGGWVSNTGPTGPCGLVEIAVIEKAKDAPLFWVYRWRHLITSKSGKLMGLSSCAEFDETEHIYDWRIPDTYMGCDYITY
jgi:hypothetical protein